LYQIKSCEGIAKLLLNLNPNKAAGPDEIKPRVLKELATEIALILTIIFQISLDTPPSASGSVKFFVRVHFSKTFKGIHLKLGILVHYQKRNQLQQGR
jgi:hypothetical protein